MHKQVCLLKLPREKKDVYISGYFNIYLKLDCNETHNDFNGYTEVINSINFVNNMIDKILCKCIPAFRGRYAYFPR